MTATGDAGLEDAVDVYSVSFWVKMLANGALVAIITYLLIKIFKNRNEPEADDVQDTVLPKMKKRDFTIQELREFDGTKGDGRILVAVNGKVFDVTKGKHFYGPGKRNIFLYKYFRTVLIQNQRLPTRQVVFILRLVDMTPLGD